MICRGTMFVRAIALFAATSMAAGCAVWSARSTLPLGEPKVARFSTLMPGEKLPKGWAPWTLSVLKKATEYELVEQDGRTVVRASADQSASGLIHEVRFDPCEYPLITWRWKVPTLIESADNTRSGLEDSPVRIVVAFEGDIAHLPALDRIAFAQFRALTKRELPYATLMYIWENRQPRDTVIRNRITSRVRMIVAESGAGRVGEWREETRDLVADYRAAFGGDPPPVKWVGIMTDSDNTRSHIRGYYGDLEIRARSTNDAIGTPAGSTPNNGASGASRDRQ